MASHYIVVSYVPDPVIEEKINIGVVVYGDGAIRSRFVRNWQRARQFGVGDIRFLQDFAKKLDNGRELSLPLAGGSDVQLLSAEGLQRIAGRWINSIQLSQPKASLKSVDELLAEV